MIPLLRVTYQSLVGPSGHMAKNSYNEHHSTLTDGLLYNSTAFARATRYIGFCPDCPTTDRYILGKDTEQGDDV